MNKRYKGNNYRYKLYSVNFPVKLHEKVEAKLRKDFEMDWTEQETAEKEIVNVTFTRNKLAKNLSTKQSEKS